MDLPLYTRRHAALDLPKVAAVDTETTRFNEPSYGWKGRTRVRPFGGHDLILGSLAHDKTYSVYHRGPLGEAFALLLIQGYDLIFHNAAFDVPVLIRAFPDLRPLLYEAVNQNRLHDTKILEPLIQIAIGSRALTQKQLVSSPSLARLAKTRAGLDLDKTSGVRLGFEQFQDPQTPIPENYLEYAATDALATYLVYKSQRAEARLLQEPLQCSYPRYADSVERFGLLSEGIQLRGSLAFAWLEQFPLRVDLDAAISLRAALEEECRRFERALILFNWAKRGPKSGKFALRFKLLRGILADYLHSLGEGAPPPEFSDTGLLSLNADFWSKLIPKIKKDLYATPETATSTPDRLSVWLRYVRARKLLQTYIYTYSSSAEHYPAYSNIGARTGRTACFCPNVQNIPKRRDGIRALFIPQPGHVFLEADFNFAELVALAQVYQHLYGGSTLGRNINSGLDPHIETAKRLFPEFSNSDEAAQKRFRQAAKAVNFGLPGGLGAKTFRKYAGQQWGVSFTEEEAVQIRRAAVAADPELARYLQEIADPEARARVVARNLEISLEDLVTAADAWGFGHDGSVRVEALFWKLRQWSFGNLPCPLKLPPAFNLAHDLFRQSTCTLTGRIRGRASFTECRNTAFQGPISDAGKLAVWLLHLAHAETPIFSPVAFVHDSILIECEPAHVERSTSLLKSVMEIAIRTVCPDIKGTANVTLLGPRWGDNTNPWGEPA